MRDMCLRKCEEVSFLSHVECMKSGMVSVLPPFPVEIKKLRRCAVHGESEVYVDKELQLGKKAIGLRSLLVFDKCCNLARNTWKSIPLLRVLDLEGARKDSPYLNELKYLIHLRYLSLKEIQTRELPSCLFDLQCLELLDLRVEEVTDLKVINKFCNMKRLRHLYLPAKFIVEGDERLTFPMDGKMETIKNFDPERCEIKGLMQMTNLRVFSIRKRYIFEKAEELKVILEAPVMKKAGQLINSLTIRIHEDVIKEDPRVLSSVERNPSFKELIIKGPQRLEKDGKKGDRVIFPSNLKRVKFDECEIGEEGDLLLGLGNLPGLQELNIYQSGLGGGGGNELSVTTHIYNKLIFSPGSFSELTKLCLVLKNHLRLYGELEVGEGALPNLRSLEATSLKMVMNKLPDNLTKVKLTDCDILGEGEDSLFARLEKLPYLQRLTISKGTGLGCKKMTFSPSSFPQLTHLHVYSLDDLEELEVGEESLPRLQCLEVMWCWRLKKVNKLPDNLTQVELWGGDIIGEASGDGSILVCLGNLPHLQHLRLTHVKRPGCKQITFSSGSFPQLTQLHFDCVGDLEEWEVGEDSLPHLQRFQMYGYSDLKKVNKLPDSLTRVELWNCELVEGGDSLLACLEKLPRLQLLSLYQTKVSLQGGKMNFPPGSFPQLTQLTLSDLYELMEWEVGEGALSNLQRLHMDMCKNLKKLPQRLLASVQIECHPCIKGIEKYNTCRHFKKRFHVIKSCCDMP